MPANPPPLPPRSARQNPSLLALCVFLWLIALLSAAAGVWLLAMRAWSLAAAALVLAAWLAAAGVGLYRLRRWGVALFGLLAAAGSISFLSDALQFSEALSEKDAAAALLALVTILAALLVPLGLIYVTLALWRQLK